MQSDQEEFDAAYITSIEICQRLDICRATIATARTRGKLPEPITITRSGQTHLLLWKRDPLEPILVQWATELADWRAARA